MSTPITSDPAAAYVAGPCQNEFGPCVEHCGACKMLAPPAAPAAGEAGLPGLLVGDQTKAAYDLLRTRLNEPFYAASGENSGQGGYDADEVEALVAELLAEKQEQWAYANDFREMLEASLKDNATLTARLTTEAAAVGEARERLMRADKAATYWEMQFKHAGEQYSKAHDRAHEYLGLLGAARAEAAEAEREKLQLHEELRGLRANPFPANRPKECMPLAFWKNDTREWMAGYLEGDGWHAGNDTAGVLIAWEAAAIVTEWLYLPAPLHRGTEEGQVPGMPQAKCHGCGLASYAARCQRADCGGKEVQGA